MRIAIEMKQSELVEEVQKVDWLRHSMPLGARVPMNDGKEEWLALGSHELRILHLVLTKAILPDGTSAASNNPNLDQLAHWALGVALWMERRGL